MRRRNLLVGAALAAAVGVGTWFAYDAMYGSSVRAGAGPYTAELAECHETITEDMQEPDDLRFLENTVWHEVTATNLLIGGRLTRLNDAGRNSTFNYQCTMRNGRVIDAGLR